MLSAKAFNLIKPEILLFGTRIIQNALNIVFHSIPKNKFLDWTKFKSNVAKSMISIFDRVENIVGKGEKASYHNVFKDLFLRVFNFLPNDKILEQSKFIVFADNKINVTQKLKFLLQRAENIVGKGENAG